MAVEMKLGGQIREHREAMGLSQDELAGRIFVSRQTVSNWETGRTYPDVQNLLLLGNLFGITLDELVKGDVEMMDEKIERNKRSIVICSMVEALLGALMVVVVLVSALVGTKRAGGVDSWSFFTLCAFVPLCVACLVVNVWCYKLRKDVDVVTYRELRAYLRGEDVDRSDRKWQPVSVGRYVAYLLIGLAVVLPIGLVGGYWLTWLLVHAGLIPA
ncbi:helix-turn-helix transcriptional regulator [Bifidobacterium sp. ESL0704]|uniref:helix-turn-helix domain-containing protein n=1 Tax=Bifidobacterium sp. ESL0704 TaxID=2983219 RepID=UPI0023FA35B6|nr:helix-turn-helix transcriptional regulator [Bifidobacterium sp. ESL0704]WEV53060.1 helix-turn-helix transcriptional regulator [Bifidobacterium sp. ESL0704]